MDHSVRLYRLSKNSLADHPTIRRTSKAWGWSSNIKPGGIKLPLSIDLLD
jgi:hypothetical protein